MYTVVQHSSRIFSSCKIETLYPSNIISQFPIPLSSCNHFTFKESDFYLFIYNLNYLFMAVLGFPGGSVSKESTCSAGDPGSIPGLGRSPGEENGNPLQYSSLENPMDRGAGRATVHGVIRSQT